MAGGEVVCVTGASGFIASHIIKKLLAKGYKVKGTVRNPNDEARIGFLNALPNAAENLTLHKADLTDPGAYDDIISGCQIVIHTAQPVALHSSNPQRDLIDPAFNGTKNVFSSIEKASDTVKLVIFTSSVAAMHHGANERGLGYAFSEEDWNEKSSVKCNPYSYAKTLAEKLAWEYANKQNRWKMVSINPGVIYGPTLSGRNESSIEIFTYICNKKIRWAAAAPMPSVDVRDVAETHILAMENPRAQGRYVCVNETIDPLTLNSMLRRKGLTGLAIKHAPKFTLYLFAPRTVLPWYYIKNNVGLPLYFDNTKIRQELGLQFTPTRITVEDTLASLIAAGHVKDPGVQIKDVKK